ncbi:MAG: aminotransferase class III-fold pyridoxal phosphate-dependent enzyme [Pseudomonadota bacterium]
MTDTAPEPMSSEKAAIIDGFRRHVSAAKADFWVSIGLPFVPGRREGPWLWDVDGAKRLFNLHTNGGTYNLGHRHPEIIRELVAAAGETDIGNGHLMSRPRAALAAAIAQSMPGDLDTTVFGVSGGEAIDLAIKVARAFTGKPGIISARGGYHGHTGLAMAAGDEKYRAPFGPAAPGFSQIPFNDIGALAAAVDNDTAAVLLETVPATLGMPIPDAGYLAGVRTLCDKHGTLLILDEVQTGLGRTGRLWGFTHFDVVPDMVVLGKGLSGGVYPITATVLRKKLESVFHADPHIHVSTFGGAEIGCRVAMKVLEMSSQPAFLAHVRSLAERIGNGCRKLAGAHPSLKGLRQLGLFMGLELADDSCGPLLSLAAYRHDLLMVYANNDRSVAQFLPPLIISLEQADWVLDRLGLALGDLDAMRGVS